MDDTETLVGGAPSGPQRSLANELLHLAQLHSAGELSDEEYQAAKRDELASAHHLDDVATSTSDASGHTSRAKKIALLVAASVAIAALAFAAVFASSGSSKKNAPPTKTIAEKTTDEAGSLRTDLCTSSDSGCVVDGTTPGVISVTITSSTIGQIQLASAGNQTGLWSNADAARMMLTRALDGTQRTADGSVSWTYYPDNGLQLVITVSK